jgi:cholest-4-en-3-one 26-monooxygenase
MSTIDFDIASLDLYTTGVPHDRFRRLRREAPVSWHAEAGGPGFWAITRHRDVLEVSKDAATYSSEAGGTQIPDLPADDLRRSVDNLAIMDPPRHTRHRALIGQSFTPNVISQMEGDIRRLVTGILNEVIERREFEFMDDFAARIPMAIILRMVGVPGEDEAQLNAWIAQLLAPDDPEYRVPPEVRASTTRRFVEYAHGLAAERRRFPREDLLSRLMAAEVDGERLTYEEFGMFFLLLLAAGTHTSRLTLGNGVLAFIRHPDQRERLLEEPGLITGAVEEILRYEPPIMHFRRTATRDVELRGQRIAKGQKVVLWYTSANRDEDVFGDPDAFDIRRTGNDHLTFGHGPHFCIGNALGRLSAKIAIGECVRRIPGMQLRGPVERVRSNWFNGMKRMPVSTGER